MAGFGTKGGKGQILKDGEKVRNVEFILYDDNVEIPLGKDGKPMSTPFGRIVSFLDAARIKCALSPVHNEDVYDLEDVIAWRKRYARNHDLVATAEEVISSSPEVGTPKVEHRHLDCYAQAPHAKEWWLDFIRGLCPEYPDWRVWRIDNPKSATLYLSHKNSPDKARYKDADVLGFGGMDLSPLFETNEVQRLYTIVDVRDAIKENHIRYYNQLLDWAISTGDFDLANSVKGNASLWNMYLNGRISERAMNKSMKCVGIVEDEIG